MYFVFFFKQKTAYEMRISDWSSDVCSSDLAEHQSPIVEIGGNQARLRREAFGKIKLFQPGRTRPLILPDRDRPRGLRRPFLERAIFATHHLFDKNVRHAF